MTDMNINEFKRLPLMGILRGVEPGCFPPLIETIFMSGLRTIEITMNTKNATDFIKKAKNISKGRLTVGAGTVLTMKDLRQALDAGASFIVMPVLVREVMRYCVKRKIPVFPGALTPQEIHRAWQKGATMVKIFPARLYGPEYFKEIKGPLNEVDLMACGGVTPENLASYFENGASAVTLGSRVFRKEWLDAKDFKKIGQCIKTYTHAYLAVRLKSVKVPGK